MCKTMLPVILSSFWLTKLYPKWGGIYTHRLFPRFLAWDYWWEDGRKARRLRAVSGRRTWQERSARRFWFDKLLDAPGSGSRIRIQDENPGSRIKIQDQDPGSGPGSGSRIQDQNPGSRIRIQDPGAGWLLADWLVGWVDYGSKMLSKWSFKMLSKLGFSNFSIYGSLDFRRAKPSRKWHLANAIPEQRYNIGPEPKFWSNKLFICCKL